MLDGLWPALRVVQHGTVLDFVHLHFNAFGAIKVLLCYSHGLLCLELC